MAKVDSSDCSYIVLQHAFYTQMLVHRNSCVDNMFVTVHITWVTL